jgi:hypothetical protein
MLRDEPLLLRIAPEHLEGDDITRCVAQIFVVDEVMGTKTLSFNDHEQPDVALIPQFLD